MRNLKPRSNGGLWPVTISVVIVALCSPASGVIIRGGDGTGNTTPPGDFPYWNALGKISKPTDSPPTDPTPFTYGGTAAYFGNGYVLTAWHIKVLDAPTSVTFGSSTYAIDAGSWTQLKNQDNTGADLALFRISGEFPNIPYVPQSAIASSTQTNNTEVYMMGYGRNRKTGLTYWKSDWTETSIPSEASYSGYKWASSGKSMRWGTNVIAGSDYTLSTSYGTTSCYYVSFDDSGDDECTVATGDSGGPVFVYSDGQWELIGLNLSYLGYTGQPSATAVFDNEPLFADLSIYRNQIMPEPATLGLLALGGLALLARRRRK